MPWHLEPILYTGRYYEPPACFEHKDDYETIATVQMIGAGRCYISGLHGKMSRRMFRELDEALTSLGIREVQGLRGDGIDIWPCRAG